MRHRVLMLLSNEYRPDVRVEKEAKALVDDGHDITVLAWDRGHKRPKEEAKDGILVNRVRTKRFDSKLGLVINYPLFILELLCISRSLQFDAVHAHDLDTLLAGVLISRLRGVPLVYDAHEHYADMVSQDLPGSIVVWFDRIESRLVPFAAKVIVANPGHYDYLSAWTTQKPVIVMNCIDPPIIQVRPPIEGPLTIFYAGSLEPLRFIEEAIEAVQTLDNVMFEIAGDGSLRQFVESAALVKRNIRYIGYIDRERLYLETSRASVIIALLDPRNANNRFGIPNRLMEAIAIGVPILASKGTQSGKLVEDIGCGLAIDWGIVPFREAIGILSSREKREIMAENGRKAARERYNWNNMKARLTDLYDNL